MGRQPRVAGAQEYPLLATVGTRNNRPHDRPNHRRKIRAGSVGVALAVPALVAGLLGTQAVAPTSVADASTKTAVHHIAFKPSKVVKIAKRYAGARYSYGGTSPAGFDCSGFTRFVYAKFGIALPHSAYAQGRLGKRVSTKHARPGDLVITSGGAHVGIYVGHNRFIDAPMPGEVVHVRKIYTSNHFFVRVKKFSTSKV